MGRICVISPSLHSGGIERVMTMLANDFVRRGHSVLFVACLPGDHFYSLDSSIQFIEPEPIQGKISRYLKLILFLRREVVKFNPDTVMVFGDYFNALVVMSLMGTGLKVYIADQMSPTRKFPFVIQLLKKVFYPLSCGIIAQTELSAYYHKQRYGKRINVRVIANPMQPMENHPQSREKIIAIVARMHRDKGIDTALDVWSKVKHKGDWKMVFAGGGDLLESMKSYAFQLGLSNHVIFLGETKEVIELLEKSEIFLMSSRGEGFPNALCEGMAAGLACICFDKLNNPQIITKNGYDGVLVENENIEAMAEKLSLLMQDESGRRAMGESARAIIHRLDIEIISPQYLNFILPQ